VQRGRLFGAQDWVRWVVNLWGMDDAMGPTEWIRKKDSRPLCFYKRMPNSGPATYALIL